MAQEINWITPDRHVDREVIERTAAELGVQFPEDYIMCVIYNHGGAPLPNIFDAGDNPAVFGELLSFDSDRNVNLKKTYSNVQDRLLSDIVPFANDFSGNLICFDYRNGKVPVIVFWDHEKAFLDPAQALTPVCDSFGELLSMLREEE